MAATGQVWSAGDDHAVVVSDARTGALLLRLTDATGPVWALALAADHVWSASADRHIRCYHAQVHYVCLLVLLCLIYIRVLRVVAPCVILRLTMHG